MIIATMYDDKDLPKIEEFLSDTKYIADSNNRLIINIDNIQHAIKIINNLNKISKLNFITEHNLALDDNGNIIPSNKSMIMGLM